MKKTVKHVVILSIFAVGLAFTRSSFAQEEGEDAVLYQKKTVYNFDDDTITGDLTRPDQEMLTGRKAARHKSLIRVRENFRQRVLQSVKDL
jgi:hypothetical protein